MINNKVLITGATGLVGTKLSKELAHLGYEVCHLIRKPVGSSPFKQYKWQPEKGYIEEGALLSAQYIVHLAGANVGDKRWSAARKKEIYDSRITGTRLLVQELNKLSVCPEAVIFASAVGFYGVSEPDIPAKEEDTSGTDFLARVTRDWEAEMDKVERTTETRVVKLRLGVVLSEEGGALSKMVFPVKLGFGSALGSGKQWIPWIHIDDLSRLFVYAIENPISGAFNAVAPEVINNIMFMKALSVRLVKPFFLPALPSVLIRFLLGEQSVIVLEGKIISCEKLIRQGFVFKYDRINRALDSLRL